MRNINFFSIFFLSFLSSVVSQYYTFVPEINTNLNWKKVASDSTGTYLIAVSYLSNSLAGSVYTSRNGGSTWTSVTPDSPTTQSWHSCAIDSTGQYFVAGNSDKGIYVSSDYGVTWTIRQAFTVASGNFLYHIATSSNGQYMFAATSIVKQDLDGTIYYSTNYGVKWTAIVITDSGIVYGIDCDNTGKLVVASAENGIYRSTNYGISGWTQVYVNTAYSIYFNIVSGKIFTKSFKYCFTDFDFLVLLFHL
jgi:photosystem II stability/assembly factor-like uncharacterized protein